MGDSTKRFDWVTQGNKGALDQKDRIQLNDLKERVGKENKATHKERARVQDDEHKRINHYSEGVCYKCHKVEQVISSLYYVCIECLEKHGDEALLNIVVQKRNIWELCDFHEKWVFHEVCQVNCSLCNTCQRRVKKLHQAYRKSGGRNNNSPDILKRKKIYGKDYNYILGTGMKGFKTKRN